MNLFKLLSNTQQTITDDLEKPYLGGDINNVLVIADLHIPYEQNGYMEFCRKVQSQYNCGTVIQIGDEVDWQAISFHDKNPHLDSPLAEFNQSKQKLKKWYELFPDVTVVKGNHTNRIERKLLFHGIPTVIMRELNDLYEVPNWKYVNSYTYNGIFYKHGDGVSITSLEKEVMYKQMPVIIGHLHKTAMIRYYTNRLFGCIVGSGVDSDSVAFNYNTSPKPSILSCVAVLNNIPVIVPFSTFS